MELKEIREWREAVLKVYNRILAGKWEYKPTGSARGECEICEANLPYVKSLRYCDTCIITKVFGHGCKMILDECEARESNFPAGKTCLKILAALDEQEKVAKHLIEEHEKAEIKRKQEEWGIGKEWWKKISPADVAIDDPVDESIISGIEEIEKRFMRVHTEYHNMWSDIRELKCKAGGRPMKLKFERCDKCGLLVDKKED